MLATFSGLNPKGPYLSLRFLCSVHLLHKAGAWNLKVSYRSCATTAKNCTKKRDARAKFFFFLPIWTYCFFFCSPSPLQNSLIFCCRNFVTTVTWRHTSLYWRVNKNKTESGNCFHIRGVWSIKGDVTRDDSQRRFLAQHNVVMLEQCCNYSKKCCNAALR